MGSDDWCPTVQSVRNQHAAVWGMFSVFLSLEGGVSLPRFVSEEKKDKCISDVLLVSL